MKCSFAGAQLLVAVLVISSTSVSFVSAQAVMADGRSLTLKTPLSPFATEGPIWALDLDNQGISVTGIKVTIPETLNDAPFLISGSSALGQDGEADTGIGGGNFDLLRDANAISEPAIDTGAVEETEPGLALGPRRLGATRSIFSTTEGGIADPVTQANIEKRYFELVELCYAVHTNALPGNFLYLAGCRGTDCDDAEGRVYPVTNGGTLKSAGHIYEDLDNGKEYYVPDVEVVIELAENVAGGKVTSLARGDAGLGRPDSFVMGGMLLIFNQDPRFGADVLGAGENVVPRKLFFEKIAIDTHVDVIGHMVGEHVLFVQEVLTELVNPASGIQITADRFRIKDQGAQGEVRWIGTVDKPTDVTLFGALLRGEPGSLTEFMRLSIPITTDLLTGFGTYTARRRGINVSGVTHIRMEAEVGGTIVPSASVLFDVREFVEIV